VNKSGLEDRREEMGKMKRKARAAHQTVSCELRSGNSKKAIAAKREIPHGTIGDIDQTR